MARPFVGPPLSLAFASTRKREPGNGRRLLSMLVLSATRGVKSSGIGVGGGTCRAQLALRRSIELARTNEYCWRKAAGRVMSATSTGIAVVVSRRFWVDEVSGGLEERLALDPIPGACC